MIKYIDNDRGFTLIELMTAILITGIITGAIAVFLSFHFRTYEISKDMVDIQYESQVALNGMTNTILEAQGVYQVIDISGIDVTGTAAEVTPKAVAFEVYDAADVDLTDYHVFYYDYNAASPEESRIYYKLCEDVGEVNDWVNIIGPTNAELFAMDISSFKVSPKDSSITFADTNSIQITITVDDGSTATDLDITSSIEVKFRNN